MVFCAPNRFAHHTEDGCLNFIIRRVKLSFMLVSLTKDDRCPLKQMSYLIKRHDRVTGFSESQPSTPATRFTLLLTKYLNKRAHPGAQLSG